MATISSVTTPTYSRKLTRDDGRIDWTKPAIQIEREIRAFISWPKSHTILASREVIITAAGIDATEGKPGKVSVQGKRLLIGTGEGSLEIIQLKPVGKAEMNAAAFLAGYRHLL
jgi:methionyl-tRNA formyltransferase